MRAEKKIIMVVALAALLIRLIIAYFLPLEIDPDAIMHLGAAEYIAKEQTFPIVEANSKRDFWVPPVYNVLLAIIIIKEKLG